MMLVKFTLSIGYSNAKHIDELEFDDEATDEMIQESYDDWCNNYLDGGWVKVDNRGETDD